MNWHQSLGELNIEASEQPLAQLSDQIIEQLQVEDTESTATKLQNIQ